MSDLWQEIKHAIHQNQFERASQLLEEIRIREGIYRSPGIGYHRVPELTQNFERQLKFEDY